MTFASSKRVLAVLLLLCMVFGLLPAVAFADGDVAEEPVIEAAEAVVEEAFEPVDENADLQAEAAVIDADAVTESVAAPEAAAAPQAAATYKLYLDKNCSSSPTVSSKTYNITSGTTVNLSKYFIDRPPVDINKDGSYYEHYEIISWNKAADGSGESYERSGSFVMPESDVTLYAIWEVSEQKHWEVIIDGNGTLKHHPFVVTPNSDDYVTVNPGDTFNIYAQNNGSFWTGTLQTITPIPAEGYVFEGWYMYGDTKLDVTELGRATLQNYKLTADILEAGRNKIVAKFVENDGSWASVKYQQAENGYVYYEQMVKKGTATPTVDNPTYTNHYFLGWEPAVSATVTDDVVYTAQWLEGPTSANTAADLYTVRCISDEGLSDTHREMSGSFAAYCSSSDDIAYDELRDVYTCTIAVDRIGTLLGVGPGCFNVYSGQEHFAVESAPVVNLVWDASANLWKADGEQIVEVTHASGNEAINDADLLAKLTKIICVTDSNDPSNYTSLNLLKNSYTIVYTQTTGNTRKAEVRITNLNAYASKLGFLYEIDWENNLHGEDYYVFYITRTLTTKSIANGTTYAAWGDWSYDKLNTEFWSTGGVKHNENLYGKELLVAVPKAPTFLVRFVDGFKDEEIFPDYEYETEAPDGFGQLPYWDAEDPYEWAIENVLQFNPDDYQLPTGEFFIDWDPELPAPDEAVTEDLVFEAQWSRWIDVSYYDGCSSEELPWGEALNSNGYLEKFEDFPEFLDEDGNDYVPERENCIFNGWMSVEDPEATEVFIDEATGYTVNVYRDEVDDMVYTSFEILLVADWTWDTEPVAAKVASLNLDGTIGVNYKVILPEDISETAEAVFLYKGSEYPVPANSVTPDSRGYSAFTFNIPAAEFANTIALKFVDQGAAIPFTLNGVRLEDDTLKYSAQEYARHLSPEKPSKHLIEMLQSYCYYAYLSLGKTAPDVCPDAVTTDPAVSSVTASDMEAFRNTGYGSVTGITPSKISLNLESTTEINIKFTLADGYDINDYRFELDGGVVVTPVQEDDKYVVTIADIDAKNLDTMYTLTVSKESETQVLNTSALAYCYTALLDAQQSAVKQDLCRALYLYNQAANTFFGA